MKLKKLSQIDNVLEVTGDYFTNGVRYSVLFEWEIDSEAAKDEVQGVLNASESKFQDPGESFGFWNDNGSSGTYVGGIHSEKIPIKELSEITDKGLIPQIESIPGVEEAYVIRRINMIFPLSLKRRSYINTTWILLEL